MFQKKYFEYTEMGAQAEVMGARPLCPLPHPIATELDKMLYDDYFCMVASNKQ